MDASRKTEREGTLFFGSHEPSQASLTNNDLTIQCGQNTCIEHCIEVSVNTYLRT